MFHNSTELSRRKTNLVSILRGWKLREILASSPLIEQLMHAKHIFFQKKSSTLVVLFARKYDENYAEIRASNVTAGSFSLKVKNYQSGTNLKHKKNALFLRTLS